MAMSVSSLRANLHRVVDEVIATGVPVEIVRNGKRVRIVADIPSRKLSRLRKRSVLRVKPDKLLNLAWSTTRSGNH